MPVLPVVPAAVSPSTDVVIVGAGQAGLATAYWLQRLAPALSVRVLERGSTVGESWLRRWDSLRLFTPRAYSALPGLAFPRGDTNPTRVEMAEYLAHYVRTFDLPVTLGTTVRRLVRSEGGFRLETDRGPFSATQVVIASGPFQDPKVPDAAAKLAPEVLQRHSSEYRHPSDLPGDDVLVVGGGNSAAQLALELAADGRRVTVVAPGRPVFLPAHILGITSYAFWDRLGILRADAEGALARRLRRRRDAIFGHELRRAVHRGAIRLVPHRLVDASGRTVNLADGTCLPVQAVLWCTGFHARYDWVAVPGALDDADNPRHVRGASPVEGLHWMGLPWQTAVDSSIIHGVDGDGRQTAERILASVADRRAAATPGVVA